jgi:hypothetical protein
MDRTDEHMARIYDRIDAGARVQIDCDHRELNAATARLVEQVDAERAIQAVLAAERDRALAWAALWKRMAIVKRRCCTVKWRLLRTTAWAIRRRYGR